MSRTVVYELNCGEERARYYTRTVLSTIKEAEPGLAGEVARQLPWTRELMVRSPNGLRVPPDNSDTTPPLRR